MALIHRIQNAMSKAVELIEEVGQTAYFTPKATGVAIKLKVMSKELGVSELVADYRQGDLKVELDASRIPGIPKKYDTIKIGNVTYSVVDPKGSPRRVGDVVYSYKFVVRGA